MVKVKGFIGMIAQPELASEIASRPYDVISREEAKELSNGKNVISRLPYFKQIFKHSYYHVIRPEISLDSTVDEHDQEVYEMGKKNLLDFVEKGYLKKDCTPRFYIYQTEYQGIVCVGIVLLVSIMEYERHIIKRHELTREDKELDRTKLIDLQNANSEPVLITYESVDSIEDVIEQVMSQQAPYINITTSDDNAQHKIWLLSEELTALLQNEFAEHVDALYIADGHHRMAASSNVAAKRREQQIKEGVNLTGNEPFEFIMSYTVSSKYLKICGYHRIIKSLDQYTAVDILEKISQDFSIQKMDISQNRYPQYKGDYSLMIGGEWYTIRVKQQSKNNHLGLTPRACEIIDVSILQELCIKPIFNIKDVRNDQNIEFVGGDDRLPEIEKKMARYDNPAAILCYPVNVKELMDVANQQQIMAPKSTWIIPKPRSGLVMRFLQ